MTIMPRLPHQAAPVLLAAVIAIALRTTLQTRHDGHLQPTSGSSLHEPDLLKTRYTGISPIDNILAHRVALSWPAASGADPSLSLFTLWYITQLFMVHLLVCLDSMRVGSHIPGVWSYVVWGLLYSFFPWGIVMPVYWILYFLRQRIGAANLKHSPQPLRYIDEIPLPRIPPLSSLLFAMLMGFGMFTLWAGVVSASESPGQKQVALVLWHLFPVWMGAIQWLFSRMPEDDKSEAKLRKKLSDTYIVVLCYGAMTQLGVVGVTLIPALLQDKVPPGPARDKVWWPVTFVPGLPWGRVEELVEDRLKMALQYDAYCACGVTLLAAIVLCREVTVTTRLRSLGAAVSRCLLLGPGGAAVAFMWERDKALLDELRMCEEKEDGRGHEKDQEFRYPAKVGDSEFMYPANASVAITPTGKEETAKRYREDRWYGQ